MYVLLQAKHAEDLGYSEKQASQLYGAMGIATVLAGPSLGGLCSFVSPTGLLVVSMLINGIATVLLPLATNYSMLLLYSVLYGICDAGFVAVGDIMILNCVSEDKRASAYGLYFMLLAIFSVPGPPLAGEQFYLIISYSFIYLFLNMERSSYSLRHLLPKYGESLMQTRNTSRARPKIKLNIFCIAFFIRSKFKYTLSRYFNVVF